MSNNPTTTPSDLLKLSFPLTEDPQGVTDELYIRRETVRTTYQLRYQLFKGEKIKNQRFFSILSEGVHYESGLEYQKKPSSATTIVQKLGHVGET